MREIAEGAAPVYRLLATRTRESWAFRAAVVLGLLCALGALLFLSIVRGTHAGQESGALHALPHLFAQLICWGVSTLAVFATAQRAFLRDHEDGIRGLLRARGKDGHYELARVVVAVSHTAMISVVLTGILAIACALAATGTSEVAATWKSALGAIVYAALFAVVMGTLAVSVLGGRGRGGGYVALLLCLVLPELLEPLTTRALPAQMVHVLPLSIPSILRAVSAPTSAAQFIGGVCGAVVVLSLSFAHAKRERARVDDAIATGLT